MFGFGQWHIGHNHSDIVGSARIKSGRHQGVHGLLRTGMRRGDGRDLFVRHLAMQSIRTDDEAAGQIGDIYVGMMPSGSPRHCVMMLRGMVASASSGNICPESMAS